MSFNLGGKRSDESVTDNIIDRVVIRRGWLVRLPDVGLPLKVSMCLRVGDRVRYSRSFLASHENIQLAQYFAQLEGTIMEIHLLAGQEVAQIDFGSALRCSSMVKLTILEKVK
jgi:hypothetical protein